MTNFVNVPSYFHHFLTLLLSAVRYNSTAQLIKLSRAIAETGNFVLNVRHNFLKLSTACFQREMQLKFGTILCLLR